VNLEIAYIKYTRGLLTSPQLPVIATQALARGYDSSSLVLLALQSEPVMAEAGPLFEAAMGELGVKLPEKSSRAGVEHTGPLSIDSADFLEPVHAAFERYGEMLVLRRLAYTAGADAGWYLVKRVEQWQELLDGGRRKTAYTVILEPELPIRGIAGDELLGEVTCLFDRLGDVMIAVLSPDSAEIGLRSVEWRTKGWKTKDAEKGLQDSEERILQLFERHKGARVAVGRDLDVWDEDIVQITGYIPDEDGVARPGAYYRP
jgi:hypothetical protein